MALDEHQLCHLEDLRDYVYATLCDHESLERGAFPMSEKILMRRGKPCGMQFFLHGPRAVAFSAIWETRQNSILFYDSTGLRFQKTQLVAAPCLEMAAA